MKTRSQSKTMSEVQKNIEMSTEVIIDEIDTTEKNSEEQIGMETTIMSKEEDMKKI